MFAQPTFQLRAKVAKRKRARRAVHEIRLAHGFKSLVSQNRAYSREVFDHAREQAKPILPVIDFEPLEGSQPVVGLDEARSIGAHGLAIRRTSLHALVGRQWLH